MFTVRQSAWICVCIATFASAASAATKYPGLNYVTPLSIRQGATTIVTVNTNGDVSTAYKVLVEGDGVSGRVVPRTDKQSKDEAHVELAVAEDAPIGPREIRLATKEAITTLGRFYVTYHRVTAESSRNDVRSQAQQIELPVAVNGRVEKAVDEDWFKFQAKSGQTVTFSVLGVRLHETIHKIGRFITHFDAMLVLTDEHGVELAANDDHYLADPLLSYKIKRDGVYFVGLREATYKGNAFYTYTLVATADPWPVQVFPLAATAGKSSRVRLRGPGYSANTLGEVAMPTDPIGLGIRMVRPRVNGKPQGETGMLVCNLPMIRERESPDPQNVAMPAGIAGMVAADSDTDEYRFAASKGVIYEFEVYARRLFSPLDAQLAVFDEKGKRVAVGDDYTTFTGRLTKDSMLTWEAPSDGRYTLQVRDALGRGGPTFAYHLRMQEAEPDFSLTCDPDLAMVGPGNRTPLYVRVKRKNGFSGPVFLKVHGLPRGVRAIVPEIHTDLTDACIVLEVAEDAPIDASAIRIEGTGKIVRGGETVTLTRQAVPLAEIYQARRRPVHTMAVAVTEPSDIALETPVQRVVLHPGESKEIPITVRRAAKYATGPVTLWADLRFRNSVFGSSLPTGVTLDARKSKVALNRSETAGKLTLTAAADAKPIERIQTTVIGLVAIEFSVFVPYCTPPIEVTVLPEK